MSATPQDLAVPPPAPAPLRCCDCGETSQLELGFVTVGTGKDGVPQRRCPLCSSVRDEGRSKVLVQLMALLLVVGAVGALTVSPRMWELFNIALIYPMAWLCVIPHEAGHGLMARLLGMRVLLVTIGIGGRLTRFHLGGVPVELRALPVSGAVWSSLDVRRAPRLRYWLIVLAGPAVNALLLLGGLELYQRGVGGWLTDPAPSPLAAFIAGNFLLLFASLFPAGEKAAGAPSSDGYKLLTIPFLGRGQFDRLRSGSRVAEAQLLINAGRFDEAEEKLRVDQPDPEFADFFFTARSHLLVSAGRLDEAEALLREQLQRPDLAALPRAVAENNLAWALFTRGDAVALAEADSLSASAFGRMPWEPAVRSTRGVILIELGRPEEGLRLLAHRINLEMTGGPAAITFAMKAYAHHQLGNGKEAGRWLRKAERACADHEVVARVRSRLIAPG